MKRKVKNGQWFLLVILGILLIIVGFGIVIWKTGWNGKTDYKLAIISANKLVMISVSPVRDMVNIFEVEGNTPVWVPGGLGWYKGDKIMKLLEEERNYRNYQEIFFYNFGFIADKVVILDNFEDWDNNRNLISEMGIFGWLKYLFWQNRVVVSSENNILVLKEVMMRDFGDNRILTDEGRLSIYNTSAETGLANFMSERLEWSGFSVMEVNNSEEVVDKCVIVYNPFLEKSYGLSVLGELFDCPAKADDNLGENEIYLYFGDGFAQMLKYSNYVRSF